MVSYIELAQSKLLDDAPSEMKIELDDDVDNEEEDTQSQYTSASRKSSIDSTASTVMTSPQFRQSYQSRLIRSSTNLPLLHSPALIKNNHPEHLLMGFAQAVGQFVLDPVLVNSSLFAPLKSMAMYHPFDMSSIGGRGGGGMLTTKRSESNLKKGMWLVILKDVG